MSLFEAKNPFQTPLLLRRSKAFTFVSLLGFVMTPPSALAMPTNGNGGGHNGPELVGTSIPDSIDRQISYKDLDDTIKSCTTEVILDLVAQGLVFSIAEDVVPNTTEVNRYGQAMDSRLDSGLGYRSTSALFSKRAGYIDFNLSLDFGVGFMKDRNTWGITLRTVYDQWKNRSISFVLEEPLPFFTFDKKILDSSYDEFGRRIKDGEILSNLRIIYPQNYGDAVPLFNPKTKRQTSLVINEGKFVSCIFAKIQGSLEEYGPPKSHRVPSYSTLDRFPTHSTQEKK